MNTPIRFAVVGCGNIGSRHAAILLSEPGARLVALCDVDRNKCSALLEPGADIPILSNYDDVLATDADVINICTPHALHSPMAIQALEAGKHVLVEKPMALTAAESLSMIEAARRNNRRLMVVKQNRYNVPIVLTKAALDNGKLGRVFMAQCNVLWNRHNGYYSESPWRGRKLLEGGALYTQVSHFLDLMIWWFGDVVDASSSVSTMGHNIETEDCGTAYIRFGSGVLGTLTWTTCVYGRNYEGSITVIGQNGIIKIGGQYLNRIEHWNVKDYPLADDVQFVDQPNKYGKFEGSSSNHDKVIRDVIEDLVSGGSRVVEGSEGMLTVRAIERIYRSARFSSPEDQTISAQSSR